MRFKVVPRPLGRDALEAVHAALPLVPDSVEDCCVRIVDRTEVASRDAAREWVTFLRALDLAEETPRGYRRVRTDPGDAALADAFGRRVLGASEVLDALESDGPLTAEEAFERARSTVPGWERDRHPDWEAEWCERTRRLLEWSVAFGLAIRDNGAYRAVDGEDASSGATGPSGEP